MQRLLARTVALGICGVLAFAMASSGGAAEGASERVVVLASYSPALQDALAAGFRKAHPGIEVRFVRRSSGDAAAFIEEEGHGQVDVYLAPTYRNFLALAARRQLAPYVPAATRVALKVRGGHPQGAEGQIHVVEAAGYGILTHGPALAGAGVSVPRSWEALADSRLRGQVLLPVPSRVGSAVALYDGILRASGWRAGWSLIGRMAANGKLADGGTSAIVDAVRRGEAVAAPIIDFAAREALHARDHLILSFPPASGLSFAYGAVLAHAPNPGSARAFLDFLLSPPGQLMFAGPPFFRWPVDPSIAVAGGGLFDDPGALRLRYDPASAAGRAGLVTVMFDALVTRRHAVLTRSWERVRQAEELWAARPSGPLRDAIDGAIHALESLPLDEVGYESSTLATRLERTGRDVRGDEEVGLIEAEWTAFFETQAARAEEYLAEVLR